MSRPIIRTTGGPKRRRRRDLTVLAIVCCLLVLGIVLYLEVFRQPHVQAPIPATAVTAPASSGP
ncbi:MAG TPA: hypothetical protein VME66_12350 [Candidatus Acidoferrales bacterium]|nr:hypothetical protein [Candidatus Acidoferrales bacterium]